MAEMIAVYSAQGSRGQDKYNVNINGKNHYPFMLWIKR